MSSLAHAGSVCSAEESHGFIRQYIFSTDHKVIGLQYFFLALAAVTIGIVLSLLMRFHLVWPDAHLPFVSGGIMTPEQYLALVTMHGTIMVFFVLTTAPQGGFGNYFLPIQIGAPDMAFPGLNMLSFWTTFVAFVCMLAAFFVAGGAPISRLDRLPAAERARRDRRARAREPGRRCGSSASAIFCLASLLGALNFIATTLDLRAKGMTLMRMPLTVLGVVRHRDPGPAGVRRAARRRDSAPARPHRRAPASFIPAGLVVNGSNCRHTAAARRCSGSTSSGSSDIPRFTSRSCRAWASRRTCSRRSRASRSLAIEAMVFAMLRDWLPRDSCVWGHHMFVSGMSPYSAFAFSVLTMAIGVPSAIKTFNWLGTLWGGKIQFTSPMLFALGFVSLFVTGGLSGLFLAQPALDLSCTTPTSCVAHFHLIMGVAAIFGIFAATYFWFPKMFGRMMNEPLGKLHFWLTFVGVYCIFMPMHFIGHRGRHPPLCGLDRRDYLAPLASGALIS